ncbi:MAG TPA: hypothetical protein VE058_12985 [Steroidobacteraceae bacterium]|nr:hypothetical protein [Steroidobacteraceae bacterium]
MLVAESNQQGEMRVLYGILARAAMERFGKVPKEETESRDIYFLGILRLLDMYRFDSIKSGAPVGILETPTFHPDYLASEQEDQGAIENALASTHASMRPNQTDKNAFVEEVKAALENVHKRGAGASTSARAIAKEFLEGLIQELKRSK